MPEVTMKVDEAQLARINGKLNSGRLTHDPAERLIHDAAKFGEAEAREQAHDAAVARTIMAEGRGLEMSVKSAVMASVESGNIGGLRAWASDKGIGEYLYPIATHKRRGVRGRFFLRKALDKLRMSEIPRLIRKAANEIEAEWKR